MMNNGLTVKLLWNVVSPFIHERSRKKFHFTGNNQNANKEFLRTVIDDDQLPSDFGGNNVSIAEILDRYSA